MRKGKQIAVTIEELREKLHDYDPLFTLKGVTKNRYLLRYNGEKLLKLIWNRRDGWSVQVLIRAV